MYDSDIGGGVWRFKALEGKVHVGGEGKAFFL